jgi:Tyrosine phosphatase family
VTARGPQDGSQPSPREREILAHLVPNLRDLGGLRTGDGRAIRSRRLIRGAAPSHAGSAALAGLGAVLGPCDLIDLRTDAEVARDGGAEALVARGWTWTRRPLADGNTASAAGAGTGGIPRAGAIEAYASAARFVADRLVSAAGSGPINGAAAPARPSVVCCSLGKDRTGAVIAILLAWAGVTRSAIERDFEFSDVCLRRQRDLLPERWRAPGSVGPADRGVLDSLRAVPSAPPDHAPPRDLRAALTAALCDERSDDVGLHVEPGATGLTGVG